MTMRSCGAQLYEQLYCAHGDMENRIKEQLSLFADRMSTATLRANQLRLYFSSFAYVLVHALRRLALAGTEWAQAQVGSIRLRLLKIAAEVRISARRIWLRYARAYPCQHRLGELFQQTVLADDVFRLLIILQQLVD